MILEHVYAHCTTCQRHVRFDIDLAIAPHLDGQVGVRCPRCRNVGIFRFRPTAAGARQQREEALKKYEEAEAQGEIRALEPREEHDAWQQFHLDMIGLPPLADDPEDATAEEPGGETRWRWEYLRGRLAEIEPR